MVRFGIRRRRFRRGTRRRRVRPRVLLRKSRRLRKVAFRKIQKKKIRKNRKIKKNVWGYMDSVHIDAAVNATKTADLASAVTKAGLGRYDDIDEVFQNVHQLDDWIYAQQGGVSGQFKANRHNLKVQVQGKATYTIASNNLAGGIYAQIYICKPKLDIASVGIGAGNGVNPPDIINNNLNSRSAPDYNDASALTVNAVGTGGVTNIVQNATTTTKPAVATTDHWTTPFMVPEFTRSWKVIKVHKVFLPPGGNFMFTIKTGLRTVTRNLSEKTAGSLAAVTWSHKFGVVPFIRFHGQPVDDQTTNTKVNFSSASLNVVIDKKYEFSYGHQATYYNVRGTDGILDVVIAKLPGLTSDTVGEP